MTLWKKCSHCQHRVHYSHKPAIFSVVGVRRRGNPPLAKNIKKYDWPARLRVHYVLPALTQFFKLLLVVMLQFSSFNDPSCEPLLCFLELWLKLTVLHSQLSVLLSLLFPLSTSLFYLNHDETTSSYTQTLLPTIISITVIIKSRGKDVGLLLTSGRSNPWKNSKKVASSWLLILLSVSKSKSFINLGGSLMSLSLTFDIS